MTDCRRIESLLPPYVDGVASAETTALVETHLETCERCRGEIAVQRAVRAVVRAHVDVLREVAPVGLRTRVNAHLQDQRSPGLGPVGRLVAGATAVATVLLLITALEFVPFRSTTLFAAQLVIDHVRCFALHLGSLDGADPQSVRGEFAKRYAWDVQVPASNRDIDLTLVHARRCPFWLGNHAHLLYRSADRDVSLYSTQGQPRADAARTLLGHFHRVWTADGDAYSVVARGLPDTQLARIADYLQRETTQLAARAGRDRQ